MHQPEESDMASIPAKQPSPLLRACLPGGGAALALVLLLMISSLT